jgi:hypothetical protein
MYGFNINAQLQVTVTLSCRHKLFALYMVMQFTNGQPLRNTSQNSVFWSGAECHC